MAVEIQTGNSGGDSPASAQPDLAGLAARLASEAGGTVPGVTASPASPPKRPRGRPPTHGLFSRAAGSDGKSRARVAPVAGEPLAAPGPATLPPDGGAPLGPPGDGPRVRLPPHLVARLAKIPWAELDKLGKAWLREKSIGIPESLKPEVESLVAATGFSPDELELLCEITPLVLEEWEVSGGELFTPTTALAILLAFKAVDFWRASRTLEKLANSQPPPKP